MALAWMLVIILTVVAAVSIGLLVAVLLFAGANALYRTEGDN